MFFIQLTSEFVFFNESVIVKVSKMEKTILVEIISTDRVNEL